MIELLKYMWSDGFWSKVLTLVFVVALTFAVLFVGIAILEGIDIIGVPLHMSYVVVNDDKFIPRHYEIEHHGKTSETVFIPDEERVILNFNNRRYYWYFSPEAYHEITNHPPQSISAIYRIGRLSGDYNVKSVTINQ